LRTLPQLNSLRVFEVAGMYLSFTVTAKHLNVTQGAVSKQIRQLEDFLGVRLFIRSSGTLALTQSGKELLQVIQYSFSAMEEEIAIIRDPDLRQRLTILAPPTFCSRWLGPKLHHFMSEFPQYDLNLYTEREDGVNFDIEINFTEIDKADSSHNILFLESFIAVCNQDLIKDAINLESNYHRMLHVRHDGSSLPSWKDWANAADLVLPSNRAKGITMSTQEQVINAAVAGCGFAIVDKNMIGTLLKNGLLIQFNPLLVRSKYGYTISSPAGRNGIAKVDAFTAWINDCALSLF